MPGGVTRRVGPGARGFNVIGVVVLILILAGVGLFYANLARQAGRSSFWFNDAQTAFDLADAGLKEAAWCLDEANSARKAAAAPVMRAGLVAAFAALMAGQKAGPIRLVSSDDASTLTEPLQGQIAALADRSPKIEVTFSIDDPKPLWDGALQGIPADPREHKLNVTLVARGSVKAPTGIRVERTITADRGARVLSLLPPLVGRFALFVNPPAGGQDTNLLSRRFDGTTGDARAEGSGAPLVVHNVVSAPIVNPGTNQLNRAGFVGGIADAKFLDHQGWVFLGGTDAAPWKLNLAHGYSDGGDSPLLPGNLSRDLYHGNANDDTAFATRYEVESRNWPGVCLVTLKPDSTAPDRGLYHMLHGVASNYEIIGMQTAAYSLVQTGGARRKFDFGNQLASAVRPFGGPEALSPTLVFGPVMRGYFRRCQLHMTLAARGLCPSFGSHLVPYFKLSDHIPKTQAILRAAFQGDAGYKAEGSGFVEDEPYMEGLNLALDSRGGGVYAQDGRLYRVPDTGPVRSFTSDRIQGLPALPAAGGIPDPILQKFIAGDVQVPGLYTGNLHAGFAALQAVLEAKLAYKITPDAFRRRIYVNRVLKVPGIAVVGDGEAIELGPVDSVRDGGILISGGPLRITGDIIRGGEPLTLVAQGPITIDPSVKTIEAYLVALSDQGKVSLPPGPFTLTGGLAARELDLTSLQTGAAPRIVKYVEDMDPLGPNKDSALRVFYGIQPRVSVEGGGGS